jgi:tetratricopeptide (TPR) repeat protein
MALLGLEEDGEAIVCFNEAIVLNPEHHDTWLNKGHSLEELGKCAEAITCYDHAISLKGVLDESE